jgi:hypothetical protein
VSDVSLALGELFADAPLTLDVRAARGAPKKRDSECNERHPDEIVEVDPMPARKNEDHLVPPLRAEPDHDRADDDCDRSCRLAQESSSLDAVRAGGRVTRSTT